MFPWSPIAGLNRGRDTTFRQTWDNAISLVRRIAEDGRHAAAVAIGIDEGRSVEAIGAGPGDLEAGVGFLKGDGFRVAVASEAGGEAIGGVEEPSIACFGREQDKLVGGDDASVTSGGPSLDGANLVGESKPRAVADSFARSGLDRPFAGGEAMDVFTK